MSAAQPISVGAEQSGRLLDNMVLFARLLRVGELNATPNQVATWVEALQHVDLSRKVQVQDSARTVLTSDVSELDWFDAAFELFWQSRDPQELQDMELTVEVSQRTQSRLIEPDEPGASDAADPEPALTWSDQEQLTDKPFADLDPHERREVERLIASMQWSPAPVTTRRKVRSSTGSSIDLRAAMRRNLRHGGELIQLPRRQRRKVPRPIVVLCDISGSMEPYARLLLHFVYALSQRHRYRARVESFAFATRLTRLSRDLSLRTIDSALAAAAERVGDWGGGTRTGQALRDFHRDWAPRVMSRGAIVIIISDGWDRGDPEQLGREMAHLSRLAGRVMWLNPLLGVEGYEPLTRGLVAALPHVSDFLPVHNLRSLQQLSTALEQVSGHG